MNKNLYVHVKNNPFGEKVSKGIAKCAGLASVYAVCASGSGLGIEFKRCENEFKALKDCLRKV